MGDNRPSQSPRTSGLFVEQLDMQRRSFVELFGETESAVFEELPEGQIAKPEQYPAAELYSPNPISIRSVQAQAGKESRNQKTDELYCFDCKKKCFSMQIRANEDPTCSI
jgi:hypothetical protein